MSIETAEIDDQRAIYTIPIEELFETFHTDPKKGLTALQVEKSMEIHGKNVVGKVKKNIYKAIIAPIINLLIIIYLLSAVAMILLGDFDRTKPIFVIVGTNMVIAIIQQFRAEKQLEALQKLSQASIVVIRNGDEMELPTDQIVVGDIIKFTQGDKIPADSRIIESTNLSINEASLTGESEPVKKFNNLDPLKGSVLSLHDRRNMAFLGTFVASGSGFALVARIGSETEIGKISKKLEKSTTGDIPLRQKMNNFAKYLGIGVLVLIAISISYSLYLLSQTSGGITLYSFKLEMADSIDLGMKVMPINLPLLTTIVLLTGVLALAQKGVIVRELSRTESLGRASVVCSDKTGTLTKNEMTAIKIWTFEGKYTVTGRGYAPDGAIGTETSPETPYKSLLLDDLILSGYLNNNSVVVRESIDILGKNKQATKWSIIGLPTEGALRVLGKKYYPDIDRIFSNYEPVHEFSFDSSIKRMSKVFLKDGNYMLYSKGATEWMLDLCSTYHNGIEIKPLKKKQKKAILENMAIYASQGYRILAIAERMLSSFELPTDYEEETVRAGYEQEMNFLGFVVIQDPPRDDVLEAIRECRSAGIQVTMITGDSVATGKAIAQELEIYNPDEHLAVEGREIDTLTDEEFGKVTCYGRVSPDHKQEIIERHQKMGKVVSMSGDGVNDALALSMADCGLAMGIAGTEVAKEAADMIITDDKFSTIVTGIREGRGLFMKIRTIIYFFISISVMEAIMLFSSTLGSNLNFEMFDYWQLNLLYVTAHMFPPLGFTFGNNSKNIMDEEPRDSAEIISKDLFKLMIIHILLMGTAIVVAYYACYLGIIRVTDFNRSGFGFSNAVTASAEIVSLEQMKARTMAFVIIFILESVFMPLQVRRINYSLMDSLRDIKWFEWIWYVPSILLLLGAIYNLDVQQVMGNAGWTLNFMYLGFGDWLICILLCLPGILGFEWLRKRARDKKRVF